MLHRTTGKDTQSRRQVQRRFPPGSFIVYGRGTVGLVVGWGPTPSTLRPSIIEPERMIGKAQSWVAYVIENDRLVTMPWEWVRSLYTMEEWETSEAGP